ncbi:MAG: spore germination protein, partial [Peptococcaceae bacterium]|nr:spore germination protein [Peptococcaceae bacterium]
MKRFIYPFRGRRGKGRPAPCEKQHETRVPAGKSSFLSPDLAANVARLKEIFRDCSDVVCREFLFAQREDIRLALVYIDGLVDKNQVSEQIMRALALDLPVAAPGAEVTKARAYHLIKERGLCIHQVKETDRLEEVVGAVLAGDTALLVDGHASAIINGARGWEGRKVEDAETEVVVRGPRDSFVETLRSNTALLRRKIKSPDLKIEMLQLGRLSRTDVALAYLKGIAGDALVAEVRERLKGIDIDAVLESGYIEELIQDNPWSPFPQINHTERPDRLAARLLEGRVGILVDGTPFALTVPSVFIENMQSAEDYYERFPPVVAVRLVRYLALFFSLALPSIYIAVVTFHHEMLPTALLLS